MRQYIEQDCTIEHNGRKFTSGGAVVTDEHVIAYVGKRQPNGIRDLTDWHGNAIGICFITSTWPIRSFMSSTMHQLQATIDGKAYTGRGMGEGMICRLRPVKSKHV
jgi:hypothetical protein